MNVLLTQSHRMRVLRALPVGLIGAMTLVAACGDNLEPTQPADDAGPRIDAAVVIGSIAITSPATGTYIENASASSAYPITGTCNVMGATVTVSVNGTATSATGTCDGTNFTVLVDSAAAPFTTGNNLVVANLGSAAMLVNVNSTAITLTRITSSVAITTPATGTYIDSTNPPAAYGVSGSCNINGATITVKVNDTAVATATCDGTGFATTVDAGAAPFLNGANALVANLALASSMISVNSSSVTLNRVSSTVAITTPATGTYIDSVNPSATYAVSGTCNVVGATVTVKVNDTTAETTTCDGTGFTTTVNAGAAPFQNGANALVANLSEAVSMISVNSSSITVSRIVGTVEITSPVTGAYVYSATNSPTYTVSGTCNVMGADVSIVINGSVQTIMPVTCNGTNFTAAVDTGSSPFQDNGNTLVANLKSTAQFVDVNSGSITLTRDLRPDAVTITSQANFVGASSDRPAAALDPSLLTSNSTTVGGTCAPQGKTISVAVGTVTSSATCSAGGTYTTTFSTAALADFTNYKLRTTVAGTTVSAAVDVFKSVAPTVSFTNIAPLFARPLAGNKRTCVDCHYTKISPATPSGNISFGRWNSCPTGGKPVGASGACVDLASNAAPYTTCDDPLADSNCLPERNAFNFQLGYYRYSSATAATNEGGYANRALPIVNDDVEAMVPVLNRIVRGKPNQSFIYKKVGGRTVSLLGLPAATTETNTAAVSAADPAVVTAANHGFQIGDSLRFSAGTLPTGLTATILYYVISAGFDTGTFQVSTTPGGSAVATSGTAGTAIRADGQSGCVHSFGTLTNVGCKTNQTAGSRMPFTQANSVTYPAAASLITTYWGPTDVALLRQWILEGARTDI